jgi:hypothetical protein
VMVELNPSFVDEPEAAKPRLEGEAPPLEADNVLAFRPTPETPAPGDQPVPQGPPPVGEPVSRLGDNAEGVRLAGQLLSAATGARWPMYLRNVKQILRVANFDERRYGFGGLMELLKACQRDGLVRIERDRRGGLRVFQGPQMARPASASGPQGAADAATPIVETPGADADFEGEIQPPPVIITDETEPDVIEIEPVSVVDTTAELLGRAKPRAPRSRAGRTGVAAAPAPASTSRTRSTAGGRKTAAKKPAATKRPARSRKSSGSDDDNFGNR